MGKAAAPAGLAVAETLVMFSQDRGVARRAFARFVAEGTQAQLPETTRQAFLGGDDFVERMAARAKPASSEVPRRQRAVRSLKHYEQAAGDRDEAIRAAYASGAYTLKAIGEHFGLHYATVSRIARQAMLQNKT